MRGKHSGGNKKKPKKKKGTQMELLKEKQNIRQHEAMYLLRNSCQMIIRFKTLRCSRAKYKKKPSRNVGFERNSIF